MAAYDEVLYQLGELHPEHPGNRLDWSGDEDQVTAAFREGIAYERGRVTEALMRHMEVIPTLIVHGEWPNRVSLYKWRASTHAWRAEQLRDEGREIMRQLGGWLG